ncbi:MAG: hypothetical protein O9313_02380 [Acetobacteraceae bacterium]|jgi:hypothetical protein|nr:hypothetical protein [Acetobacteraceae bacterium]
MNASRKPVVDELVKRQKAFLEKISGDTVKGIEKILLAERMTVPTKRKPAEKAGKS